MNGTENDFIKESDDDNSSDPESNFYVKEATEWDFLELFRYSVSDFKF